LVHEDPRVYLHLCSVYHLPTLFRDVFTEERRCFSPAIPTGSDEAIFKLKKGARV
jgi:hypothetical protein